MKTDSDELKRMAGERVIEFIKPGMVVGLGSGSTAYYAVKKLGELLSEGALHDIRGIATSNATEANAKKFGIPLTDLSANPQIDLTFDGADEVDSELDLIKGGGGALLREKIVAQASRRVFIVVDESKLSEKLGERWSVPVEVVSMAERVETDFLESLGASCRTRRNNGGERYITDEGNLIIDAGFGIIEDKRELARLLSVRAGIVETGLFIGFATDLVCATGHGVKYIEKSSVDRYQNLFSKPENKV